VGPLYWIIVGLIAGWLAGKVMKSDHGILVDLAVGMVGAVVGGWIFGLLGIWARGGIVSSVVVAFVGAVFLIWLSRLLNKRSRA
jgi:uncharacterized membrane protein YeaQ/YmgE (transglycosylase-associated protein family)